MLNFYWSFCSETSHHKCCLTDKRTTSEKIASSENSMHKMLIQQSLKCYLRKVQPPRYRIMPASKKRSGTKTQAASPPIATNNSLPKSSFSSCLILPHFSFHRRREKEHQQSQKESSSCFSRISAQSCYCSFLIPLCFFVWKKV